MVVDRPHHVLIDRLLLAGLAKLRRLDQQGLVKVQCPATEEEAAELVAHYDSKGNRHLDHEEWSAMLEDVVMHRGDWSGCHLRKTVSDLGEMRSEIREIAEDLAAIQRTRRERFAMLAQMVRGRALGRTATGVDGGNAARPER